MKKPRYLAKAFSVLKKQRAQYPLSQENTEIHMGTLIMI